MLPVLLSLLLLRFLCDGMYKEKFYLFYIWQRESIENSINQFRLGNRIFSWLFNDSSYVYERAAYILLTWKQNDIVQGRILMGFLILHNISAGITVLCPFLGWISVKVKL